MGYRSQSYINLLAISDIVTVDYFSVRKSKVEHAFQHL